MQYWLFKEEPSYYSFADLQRDGSTRWDGVTNNLALIHLRKVKRGDHVFFYHSGDVKAIVGRMEVLGDPYPDPQAADPRHVVVDVQPLEALPRPVPLSAIKADPLFAEWELLRISRLSVMPVPARLWKRILALGQAE